MWLAKQSRRAPRLSFIENKPLLWHEKTQGKLRTPFEEHAAPHTVLIAREFSVKFIKVVPVLTAR